MARHEIPSHDAERLEPWIGVPRVKALTNAVKRLADRLDGRRLVNITGDDRSKGGVFEILRCTLPYLRGGGVAVEWLDIPTLAEARPALEYFHVLAHGIAPGPHWREELATRTSQLEIFADRAAAEIRPLLRRDDVLILHDTQAAPLAATLTEWSRSSAWHGHIGTTDENDRVRAYWEVLGPALRRPRVRIVYALGFLPRSLRGDSVAASPGLEPASEKSKLVPMTAARRHLHRLGASVRWHGSAPSESAFLLAQLSRWDPLKNMAGAVRVSGAVSKQLPGTQAIVMGPAAQSANERRELALALEERERLSPTARSAVHIAEVDRCGTREHDLAVRTVQCAADVVMQRSVQEGFGLTVTEALWRGCPVVASRVGGISLQADEAYSVLLPPEACDREWISAVTSLLRNDRRRERMGRAAHEAIRDGHLVDRQLASAIGGALRIVDK